MDSDGGRAESSLLWTDASLTKRKAITLSRMHATIISRSQRRRRRHSFAWLGCDLLLLSLVILCTPYPTASNDDEHKSPAYLAAQTIDRQLQQGPKYFPKWGLDSDSSYCEEINNPADFTTYDTLQECCTTWFPNQSSGLCLSNNNSPKYYPKWGLDSDSNYCQEINNPGADFTTYDSLQECCTTWFPNQSSGLCLSNNNFENTVQKFDTDEVTFKDESTGLCNEVAISSQTSSTGSATTETSTIGSPYGIVFSIKNEGNQRVEISSLSVEMDTTNQVGFALYVIDGLYIRERGNDGTVISTSIGNGVANQQFSVTSNGTQTNVNTGGNNSNNIQSQWQEVASGQFQYSNDYMLDEDSAVLLPFSSFSSGVGNSTTVGLDANSTKSFYLKMTGTVMKVEKLGQGGETVDGLASTVSTGNGSGLKMYVGRGVVFPNWIDVSGYTALEFDAFYYPARLLGKVWTQEACPATAAPASELITSKPSVSPTSEPSRPPSQAPSNSPTPLPSNSPTIRPSSSPSRSPSSGPSSSPSRSPTVAPTTADPSFTPSISPTVTMQPTYNPSESPSISSNPTQIPSAQPSLSPSQPPSSVPSLHPSLLPSSSVFPSAAPTTELNYLTITDEFMFNIWHPPGDEAQAQVEKDIIGNVTESFNNHLFTDPKSLLYPFARDYGLAISPATEPTVRLVEDAKGVKCKTDNKLENRANVCYSYALEITFQHSRKVPQGVMKSWLLDANISGDLNASYQGAKAARSSQLIVFNNARNVNAEERPTFCHAIEEELVESQYLTNYTILHVNCSRFDFVPFELIRDRGLLRRAQEADALIIGELNVTFTVTGEYRFADSLQGEERRVDFGDLVEDSINADPVKVVKNLEERNITAVKDSTVVGYELDPLTPAPTQAPTPAKPVKIADNTPTENFATSTTGLAVIIICAIAALVVAGILFYKGMKRPKFSDDEEFYDYDNTKDGKGMMDREDSHATVISPAQTDHTAVSRHRAPEPKDGIPHRYTGRETNIFGEVVGVDSSAAASRTPNERKNSRHNQQRNRTSHQDRLGRTHLSDGSHESLWSRKNPNGSATETLDEFEARILRKSNRPSGSRSGVDRSSLDQLDSFEARILRKSNGSDGDRSSRKSMRSDHDKSGDKLDVVEARAIQKSGNPSNSQRARDRFDARLASKLAESDLSNGHSAGSGSASGSTSTFEDRLAQKMKQGNRDATIGHRTKSDETFDDRVKRKLEQGSKSGATPGSSSDNTTIGNHRESFEDRLSRKMKQGPVAAPEYVTSNGSESSARSAFDRWEEKLRKKNGGYEQDRFEASENSQSLLQRKKEGTYTRGRSADSQKSVSTERSRSVSTERSASLGPERQRSRSNDAGRELDSFEARIQHKLDEGKTNQSADGSSERYEALIQRKKEGGGIGRQRGLSPASHSTRSSGKHGSDSSFERRLEEKLKQSNGSQGSPESMFEKKLKMKLDKEGKRSDDKPARKVEEVRTKSAAQEKGPAEIERQRRAEISAIMSNKSLSREEKKHQMDMVRAKYATKSSKYHRPQQDSQRMKDFEARIQAKSRG